MNRKTRLRLGKQWANNYSKDNNKIIYAYTRKFKVSKLCAINDLSSFGIKLDQREVDNIRLDCHYNHIQPIPKKKLLEIQNRLNSYKDEIDIYLIK